MIKLLRKKLDAYIKRVCSFDCSNDDMDRFENYYIIRHLGYMTYSEAKEWCVSLREGNGYSRKHNDGHLDDCWMAFLDNQR